MNSYNQQTCRKEQSVWVEKYDISEKIRTAYPATSSKAYVVISPVTSNNTTIVTLLGTARTPVTDNQFNYSPTRVNLQLPIEREVPWVNDLYLKRTRRKPSITIIKELDRILHTQKFSLCNRILKEIDYKRIGAQLSVVILRKLSVSKYSFDEWDNSVKKVKDLVLESGHNPLEKMVGLI